MDVIGGAFFGVVVSRIACGLSARSGGQSGMPLHARRAADHYPDRDGSALADHYVVLTGSYEAGSFHRITTGPDTGLWAWEARLGIASARFAAGGIVQTGDECRTLIGQSFRAMLARADLRERPDAKAGPPHRAPPGTLSDPSTLPPYGREFDRRLGPVQRNELRITVRSGALVVGLLSRSTHGPEIWTWMLSGVPRPDEDDFRWHGEAKDEAQAFLSIEASWLRWCYRAGLEPIAPLQRGRRT